MKNSTFIPAGIAVVVALIGLTFIWELKGDAADLHKQIAYQENQAQALRTKLDAAEKRLAHLESRLGSTDRAILVGDEKAMSLLTPNALAFYKAGKILASISVGEEGGIVEVGNADGKPMASLGSAKLIDKDGTKTTTPPGTLVLYKNDGYVSVQLPVPR